MCSVSSFLAFYYKIPYQKFTCVGLLNRSKILYLFRVLFLSLAFYSAIPYQNIFSLALLAQPQIFNLFLVLFLSHLALYSVIPYK